MSILNIIFFSYFLHRSALPKRQNVTLQAISEEENGVIPEMIASWNGTYLTKILTKYKLKNIITATNLVSSIKHFQISLCTNERCSGRKHSKVKLTKLAAGNAMRKTLPMFVIVVSVVLKVCPAVIVQTKKSLNGWDLCTKQVKEVDKKFASKDRKVTLIIDNCPHIH